MPALTTTVGDVSGVIALAGLLLVAHRHPPARVEALSAIGATALVLASGLVPVDEAWDDLRPLLPVVVFLVTILVVAEMCARAGVFTAAAHRVRRHSRGRPASLFAGTFVLAALVTTVLSLDATVVLVTPVAVGAATGLRLSPRPVAYACLRMANSASLLLPISNLTNLLAMPRLDLTFAEFAVRMAPALAAVLVVEYVGLRLLFRRELAEPAHRPPDDEAPRLEPVPVVVVALMLLGFGVGSSFGVEPAWVSAAAALVLVAWARHRRIVSWTSVAHAGHPSFALFVLALGVVVAGLTRGFLGDWLARLLPGGSSYGSLLLVAAIATVAAALLTNLAATLLLVPLLAPLGTDAILAALVGLGVGSGLTWTGSLANLLWRRTLVRHGDPGPMLGTAVFHRVSMTLTPVAVVAAVTALAVF
ncbi:arsenical pump membrane protein [Nocardioides terrae]|uniref:Arsenical pump membrane protein n=1 Tax=Nocardioides terrae TaxID=574651 RepID=A0A1I1DWP7_9ACTN|nr:SLC13 family permease [Nocardioides terrae]SFB78836.1 arsenical pump membrane protein [Nocardioides terrae]